MPVREDCEPDALLAAYEAALVAPDGSALPPCDALLAVLKEACEAQVPLSALELRYARVPTNNTHGAGCIAGVAADGFLAHRRCWRRRRRRCRRRRRRRR